MEPLKFEKVMRMQQRYSGEVRVFCVPWRSGIRAADLNVEATAGRTKKGL
jgi:hypothetical protein